MTLEIVRPLVVPSLRGTAPGAPLAADIGNDGQIVDIREEGPMTDDPGWITVASAAERAGVSTSTVRSWYRSGRLATQRRDGERGAFLVPLEDVLRLAAVADETGEAEGDSIIDINAGYWAAETEAAREAQRVAEAASDEANIEVRRLTADLEDARSQIEAARDQLNGIRGESAGFERLATQRAEELRLVRDQLAEAEAEATALREAVGDLEAELAETRRTATFGSITSTTWVEAVPEGYRGPVRRQGSLPEDGWDHPDEEFAAPSPNHQVELGGASEVLVETASLATTEPVAEAEERTAADADDVLPAPPAKGRRSRR